jgi:hypothetical protein
VFNNTEYKHKTSNTHTGKDLHIVFAKLTNVDLSTNKVRMIYKGHEIKAEHLLYQHKIDPAYPKILVSVRKLEEDEL